MADPSGARRSTRRPRQQVTSTTTRFTVRGSRNGSLVQVTWAAGGVLTGDFPTCDLIEVQAAMARTAQGDPAYGREVGDLYGPLPDDPLAEPEAAYRVVQQVLDAIREVDVVDPGTA
ncbi:hypothetical protein [Blastococcus sp. SYSU D00820]